MRHLLLFAVASCAVGGSVAAAQGWTPGEEIVGQTATVEANGIVNQVQLLPGGQARIVSASGRVVPASWTASAGQLCLNTGGAIECWPYQAPFEAGRTVALTSNCNVTSRWTANGVNSRAMQQAPQAGERG